jgi:hypothetical protein
VNDLFAKVQRDLDWANSALAEGDSAFRAFLSDPRNFARVTEIDRKTAERVEKIKMVQPLPTDVERKLTEAMTLTRHSFDRSLNAACAAIGLCVEINYPWADNPCPSLTWRLQHKKTGHDIVPRVLWDTIRAHEPYPASDSYSGGDTLIRQMSTYANRKHSIGYAVRGQIVSMSNHFIGGDFSAGDSVPFPTWDSVRNEVELLRTTSSKAHVGQDCKFAFEVTFDGAPPVGAITAGRAMRLFIDKAQDVLDSFKIAVGGNT